ncbi:hypothetical protein EV715DRAFT_277754 [Schizophyllum commune]
MKSTLFLLLLAVVAIAQKDTSGNDDEQDDNDETSTDADDSETTTHHGSKTASSSKHTESAQPNSQKCIVGCTAPIARQYGCTSIRDFPCVCNSEDFMSDMENCLKKECTADQRDSAVGMIKGNCGAYATKTSMLATQISTQEAGWAGYGNDASHIHLSFNNLMARRPRARRAFPPASYNARTDLQCVCTSASFQDDAKSCLQDNCTEEEQQTALQLQAAECAAIGSASESGSAATSTGTLASSSASSASNSASSASRTRTSSGSDATSTGPSSTTSSDAAASATDSNAASGMHHEFFLVGGVVAPVIAVEIGGLMVGAAMVML